MEDRDKFQEDLNNLEVWSKDWQMSFNVDKCKVMHVGSTNPQYNYTMNNIALTPVEEEKDLGVLIHNSMKTTAVLQVPYKSHEGDAIGNKYLIQLKGDDCHGHGTHCDGSSSGSSVGIAPSSSLYSVSFELPRIRFNIRHHLRQYETLKTFSAGLDAIIAGGATPSISVVSMSIGGGANIILDNATVTVGATDSSDRRASFSNFGSCVNIFAPGDSVKSASHSCVIAVHLGAEQCSSNSSCRNKVLGDGTSNVVSNPSSGSPNLLLFCE
ncbi:aqualysin-1-like [Ptychodera flava]|uniref:aqualysin-1-like n=1 Tax=Ptychodera flava TaxID=63121 RepID=UPI00396A4A85